MSTGPLDRAGLVPFAYAKVNVNGDSPLSNSGITTSKLGTGVYQLKLSAEQEISEADSYLQVQSWHYAAFSTVQQPAPDTFLVLFYNAAGAAIDCDFTAMLFSTVTPPV